MILRKTNCIYTNTNLFLHKFWSWKSVRLCGSGLDLWKYDLSVEIKHAIESYWHDKLPEQTFDECKIENKQYILSMFPYPSGQLHMGHVRVYTISDTMARFYRMNGKNVLHPIGWDAFGLPAENAAIEHKISASSWTTQNIKNMKEQLIQLGCSFDWNREITTCDSEYYKWTQFLFLMLFKEGLAYRKYALVNWDPVDNTVLADEQVDQSGCSWRSGAKVEKKLLNQWFIRTTKFAKDLVQGLDNPILEDWKDIVKLQKHWIGECNGHAIDLPLVDATSVEHLTVWTKHLEMLGHALFVAVPRHSILAKLEHANKYGDDYYQLKAKAKNPITNKTLPIYVTNQVDYAAGYDGYIGIPSACEHDAKICSYLGLSFEVEKMKNKKESAEIRKTIKNLALMLNLNCYRTSSKLKDWLISRQRYWGTPIPIIHCETCGLVPVPEIDLPVKLPVINNILKKDFSPLLNNHDWQETSCPSCARPALRETDTMDTFVDSSWYYLRYIDNKNSDQPFDVNKSKQITPVDLYIGGKEHATLHLYYARFMSYFLYSKNLLSCPEPFKRLLVQGMVKGLSFRVKNTGEYVSEEQVNVIDRKKGKAVLKNSNESVVMAWEKMSKSKKNGINPQDMFKCFGTDTTRLLILADVAPTSSRHWNTATFPGILNWQKRLWLTLQNFIHMRKTSNEVDFMEPVFIEHEMKLFDSRNFYIKETTFNYSSSHQLSVAISKMQGLTNSLRKTIPPVVSQGLQYERCLGSLILLLAPMAPHFASELWAGFIKVPRLDLSNRNYGSMNLYLMHIQENEFNYNKKVLEQRWPEVDKHYCLDLVIKINGDDYTVIKIPCFKLNNLKEDIALELAKKEPSVIKMLSSYGLHKHYYRLHKNYEAEINFLTKIKQKKKNWDINKIDKKI